MGVEKKDFIFLSSVIFLIALAAKFMGGVFPVVGGPVFGIIAGIMLSGYFQSRGAQSVFKDMSKNLLQYSIILIGFELDINNVLKVGGNSLALMVTTIAFTMALALFLGKMLKLSLNTVLLIGAGTSICGGSAIIATAAVIKAADEEIIHSLSTIFIFNIIAAFVFPLIGSFLQMSDHAFGMWAGTAINDSSSVMAAGFTFSDQAGRLAAIVKLTRTLMIIPVTFLISLFYSRACGGGGGYDVKKIFPWFIASFALASLARTVFAGNVDAEIFSVLASAGKFLVIAALSAIGLNTNLSALFKNGRRPIFLGLVCWIALCAFSFALIKFF